MRALHVFVLTVAVLPLSTRAVEPTSPPQLRAQAAWGRLPLSFEANEGQADRRVRFLASAGRGTLALTSSGATFASRDGAFAMKLEGARPATLRAEEALPGKANYFLGDQPSAWRTNVSTWRRVRYQGVYPGIDLVFYGDQQQLEYDFVVAPGGAPESIRLSFEGADGLDVDGEGNLRIRLRDTVVLHRRPLVYQLVNGERRALAGRYARLSATEAGFRVAAWDRSRALVIDPVVDYATYVGGASSDWGYAIAVDGAGNAYVAGSTTSANFPLAGPYQASLRGFGDAVVLKLNAAGSALVYATYLGGTGSEAAQGISLDGAGNAFVSGWTTSTNFPTVNPYQAANGGGYDAFAVKLSASGAALTYATYLGGSADERGYGSAIDAAGNAYLTGSTASANFPTAGPLQATFGGGAIDAFVAKLSAAGSSLVYSTFLGGGATDYGRAIAVDGAGTAYVTGATGSTNFPTASPRQASSGGGSDAFVARLNAAGSALTWSTYLGGSGDDYGQGIAIDGAGSAFVTGRAGSTDFPTASPVQASAGGGSFDAFVSKLNAAGSALTWSTYLGGSGDDEGLAIAVDASGNAWITGDTSSSNFPPGSTYAGGSDAFVVKVNAAGSALADATSLGGPGYEQGNGIAVDGAGNVFVAGQSTAAGFPVARAYQATYGGGLYDGFVAKLLVSSTPLPTTPGSPSAMPNPSAGSVAVSWGPSTDPGGPGLAGYELQVSPDDGGTFSPLATTATASYAYTAVQGSYRYRARARDSAGATSAWSATSAAEVVDTTPPSVPGAPSGAVDPSTGSVTVSWAASTDTGGSGLKEYDLQVSAGGGTFSPVQTTAGTSSVYAAAEGSYRFRVLARDNVGNESAWSATSSAVVVGAPDGGGVDAGVDAGLDAGADAGTAEPADAGAPDGGSTAERPGCGCGAGPACPAWLPLVALAFIAAARRRRAADRHRRHEGDGDDLPAFGHVRPPAS